MAAKVNRVLEALIQIRDEQKQVRREIFELRHEFSELKGVVATEMSATAGVLMDIRTLLRDRLDQRDTVADHERRIRKLERRTSG